MHIPAKLGKIRQVPATKGCRKVAGIEPQFPLQFPPFGWWVAFVPVGSFRSRMGQGKYFSLRPGAGLAAGREVFPLRCAALPLRDLLEE